MQLKDMPREKIREQLLEVDFDVAMRRAFIALSLCSLSVVYILPAGRSSSKAEREA
jgi:hypothetical protein